MIHLISYKNSKNHMYLVNLGFFLHLLCLNLQLVLCSLFPTEPIVWFCMHEFAMKLFLNCRLIVIISVVRVVTISLSLASLHFGRIFNPVVPEEKIDVIKNRIQPKK